MGYRRDGGKVTRFHSTSLSAGAWSQPRRVVIKVKVSEQALTPALLSPTSSRSPAKVLYRHSTARVAKRKIRSEPTNCT